MSLAAKQPYEHTHTAVSKMICDNNLEILELSVKSCD
jgi:hypothetical protein